MSKSLPSIPLLKIYCWEYSSRTIWKIQIGYANGSLNFVLYTGCPTKHDSCWKVLNVFFHISYWILKTFCMPFRKKHLFLNYTLLWNQFYNNIIGIQYFSSFSLISNKLTNYGRRHFKLFINCHVLWDTLPTIPLILYYIYREDMPTDLILKLDLNKLDPFPMTVSIF